MVKADTLIRYGLYNRKNPYIRLEGVHHKAPWRCVCPKCYNLTMTDTRATDPIRKYQTCIVCGWHGPQSDTMTLREMIQKETVNKGGQLYLR